MKKHYTTGEVAKKFKIPVNQIHNWHRDGKLNLNFEERKTRIANADIREAKRLSVIYHIRKILEKFQGRKIRTDISRRALHEMVAPDHRDAMRKTLAEFFNIPYKPQDDWDGFKAFIDYVVEKWDPDKPIGMKVFYGECDHHYLTLCPHRMCSGVKGELIRVMVGDEHCRSCDYFDSINTKAMYVICTRSQKAGVVEQQEIKVVEHKQQQDRKQYNDPERVEQIKEAETSLAKKFYEKISQLWGVHKVIEKAVDQNTIDIGVVKKQIGLLLKIRDEALEKVCHNESSKAVETELDARISEYKFSYETAKGFILNTPCPFDNTKTVMIGSNSCGTCIRHRGSDRHRQVVFCTFPRRGKAEQL